MRANQARWPIATIAETLHVMFTPARGLLAVFSAVIDPGSCLHEYVLHGGQLGYRRRVAARLQQNVQFGTVLVHPRATRRGARHAPF
jgi:hypothetical protein